MNDPVHVPLDYGQLRHLISLVRRDLRKTESGARRKPFVPEPGRLNVADVKLDLGRQLLATLVRCLAVAGKDDSPVG